MKQSIQHHNNTGSLQNIISSIIKPLSFAAKNNFANLDKVKGLEPLITSLVEKALPLAGDTAIKKTLEGLHASFAGFTDLSTDDQKRAIQECLSQLHTQPSENRRRTPPCNHLSIDDSLTMLARPVTDIKGVGPKTATALDNMNIVTFEDLLYLLPRTYIDQRNVCAIRQLEPGMQATVTGTVMKSTAGRLKGRRRVFTITVSDGTGTISGKWFQVSGAYGNSLKAKFSSGAKVLLAGRVSSFRFNLEMHHPEIQLLEDESDITDLVSIVPVYPLTEGLQQRTIQKIAKELLRKHVRVLAEYLPEDILTTFNLLPIQEAFLQAHEPDNNAGIDHYMQYASEAHRRIIFDEFFLLQLMLALRKKGTAVEAGISYSIPQDTVERLKDILPFSLTGSQQKVLAEVFEDMRHPHPMSRLIQGDVGSGKTVLALLACLAAIENGYQAVIMAPTEILAEQHYSTICTLLGTADVGPHLLTGSMSAAEKQSLLESIGNGTARLIVGTHALIQEGVTFERLGLAIIDEQHKFGVMQRAVLRNKGHNPDVIVMTATPIPRTLGLTVYGDIDISTITELPPGRKPVVTQLFSESKRSSVYDIARSTLANGNQVFIVYPLVEESEKMDLMDATNMSQRLQQDVFPDYRVGLVHGKMDTADKEHAMEKFKKGTLHILVATTVIEVGIDVPNASLMIIEHAERFGLSQLHQLRGRVGRGAAESMCILLAQYTTSDDAEKRLHIMEETNDGFRIAEADFDIRGPGEFLGTRQSGLPDFRVANIARDIRILTDARKAAFTLVDKDPYLKKTEHAKLKKMLQHRWKGRLELAVIG